MLQRLRLTPPDALESRGEQAREDPAVPMADRLVRVENDPPAGAARAVARAIAEADGPLGGALVLQRYGHLYKGARRQAAIALESHVFKAP